MEGCFKTAGGNKEKQRSGGRNSKEVFKKYLGYLRGPWICYYIWPSFATWAIGEYLYDLPRRGRQVWKYRLQHYRFGFQAHSAGTTMWMVLLHSNVRRKVWVNRSDSGSNRSNKSAWHWKPEGACKVEYNILDNPSHEPWWSRMNRKIGTDKSTPCENIRGLISQSFYLLNGGHRFSDTK